MLRYRFLRSERVFDSVQQLSVSTQAQQLRQFAQSVAPNRGGGFKPATMNTGGEFRPQTTARADSPHALLMLISEGVAGFMTDVNPPTRLADFTEPFFSLWTHSCKKKEKKRKGRSSHNESILKLFRRFPQLLNEPCGGIVFAALRSKLTVSCHARV